MLNEDLQETKRLCVGAVAVDEASDDLICSCESSLAMKAATPSEVVISKWIEINKLDGFELFEWQDYDQQRQRHLMKVYEHTWVVGVKDSGELKARLACCDYKDGEEVPGTFCPTPSSTAVRVFEAVSLIKGYHERHSDVVSAFPHAPEEDDVFTQAPKEWMEAHGKTRAMGCWRLVRSPYGRRTAGCNFRDFFERL